MTTHAAAKNEFQSWIGALDQKVLTDDEKRLLHIYVDHFDELANLGTAQGKRATRIGELIKDKGSVTPATMPQAPATTTTTADAVQSLVAMDIGPFRGFTASQPFTFDRQFAFLYGPNGSGKSSFCEGLEYALIGTIAEADAKRIDVQTYIRNEHANHGVRPKVTAKVASGATADVTPSETHRFAFVERNRIDGFARMSATTEKLQADRIATLFGLDQFTDFVNGFTENFDRKHLQPLENEHATAVATQQAIIARLFLNQTTIKADAKRLPAEIIALAMDAGVAEDSSLDDIRSHLKGEHEGGGALGRLLAMSSGSVPADLDATALDRAVASHRQLVRLLTSIGDRTRQLLADASKVNFKSLYQTVRSIAEDQTVDQTICPACLTRLSSTVANPFERATAELAKMDELARLQGEIEQEVRAAGTIVTALNGELAVINAMRTMIDTLTLPLCEALSAPGNDASRGAWLLVLNAELQAFESLSATFHVLRPAIQAHNAALTQRRVEQERVQSEIRQVTNLIARHAALVEKQAAAITSMTSCKKQIAEQQQQLQVLETRRAELQIAVDRNLSFVQAYKSLRTKLVEHHASLPAKMSVGLADIALDFYNHINSGDSHFHKITKLILPVAPTNKIEVWLGSDARGHNALHILSEGHIRCLGLSILLAKVVKLDLKFIVYDDIVNAIDDDHRDGIASLLLEHPLLKDRQQIITCHGEIFIQKLESRLGASNVDKKVNNYRFAPADLSPQRGIKVSTGKAHHYVVLARQSFNANSLKNCAALCRQAIEALVEAAWKKLNVRVSIQLAAPGDRPTLSNMINGLATSLKTVPFAPESTFKEDLEVLRTRYANLLLNKGTHHQEDLPEFDRADLKTMVTLIERMDAEVLSLKSSTTAVPMVKQ